MTRLTPISICYLSSSLTEFVLRNADEAPDAHPFLCLVSSFTELVLRNADEAPDA
jgi:hypothetical protein